MTSVIWRLVERGAVLSCAVRMTPAPTSRSPPSLDDEFTHNGEVMSLRLIFLHIIEE
jgi:hypothetical protein